MFRAIPKRPAMTGSRLGRYAETGQLPGFSRNREKGPSLKFQNISVLSVIARVMAEHFIGMERLLEIIRLTKCNTEPLDIIGELESEDIHKDKRPEKKRGPGGGGKPGERLREPEKREHQQSPRGRYQAHQSGEKPKHVQSEATKMHVGHELPGKKQKVRRKR